ncbi:MAG: DsbA family protein [Rickettsiales bacterium]|nr:DsbA family protein [Rickettsiales bacterium]
MTFINNNFQDKKSISKPVFVLLAIIIVIGGVYYFFGDQETKNEKISKNSTIRTARDVEAVIAQWIDENPEKILLSVQKMQAKATQEKQKDASKNISKRKKDIFDDKAPQYAPKGYDITIVEFFDYNCGYCKKARDNVDELIKEDKKVRVIFKEYPILGPQSIEMSTVALAVQINYPKSYFEFHNALMKSKERGKDGAYKIAKSLGLNVKKLENTVARDADKIAKMISDNHELGKEIGVTGTPGFVIGEELLPGAYPLDVMKEKIAEVRNK